MNLIDLMIGDGRVKSGGNEYSDNPAIVDNVNDSKQERPTGNTKQQGLRKLRKSSPELLKKVERGEMSVNAAMIQAVIDKPNFAPCLYFLPTTLCKFFSIHRQSFLLSSRSVQKMPTSKAPNLKGGRKYISKKDEQIIKAIFAKLQIIVSNSI